MKKINKPIIFGGEPYPKNSTAVIMIGGAGSNKKEVVQNMMEIDGEVFSSERGLEIALTSEKAKKKLMRRGFDLDLLDMTVPKNITEVYDKLESMGELNRGIPNDLSSRILLSNGDYKPNLIDIDEVEDGIDFYNLTFSIKNMKYNNKDIHIVWVIEDYEDVKRRKLSNIDCRVVSDIDLKVTHEATGNLMREIINGSLNLSEYMDGDIWLVLGEHEIIQIKKAGRPIENNKLNDHILNTIHESVPVIRGKHLLNKRRNIHGVWKEIIKKTPTIQEFLGNVECHNMIGSDTIFTESIDGDSYVVAKVIGIEGNISNRVGGNEYDSVDLNNFKSELTHYIVDAINEKLEREK